MDRSPVSLKLLQRAVDNAINGVVIADYCQPDMPIIYVNQGFEKLTGYSKDEIIGKNCRFLQGTDTNQSDIDKIKWAVKNQKECKVTLLNYRKDGSPFWNELTISPLFDGQENLTHFVGIQDDISKRIEAEQNLIIANNQLEDFSASIAHDLRAPLRQITSYMQLLQRKDLSCLDEDGKTFMNYIINSSMKMDDLIKNLLDFSRLTKENLSVDAVDLNGYIQDLVEDLKTEYKEARMKFEIHNLPLIHADQSLIQQVFSNLIRNAVKYSSKSTAPKVSIKLETQEDRYIFSVADNGIGFDMLYKDSLFQLFKRMPNANAFEGTGVGLAIVKNIVERHQGKIWAESVPNEGATFYFSLPKLN